MESLFEILTPAVLKSYHYNNPMFLWALPMVPLPFILRWLFYFRFTQKLDVAFRKGGMATSPVTYLRFLPPLLLMSAMALILIALARPQRSNESVERSSEGIDIMLLLDISESMKIEDFKPNRLEAAKRVAKDFVDGRFEDRIGVVVFRGEAYSLVPLTTDYQLVKKYIDDIKFNMISKPRTAIGSALAVATNRMRESKSETKVVILLSDGENTAGNIEPLTAARLARAFNIKLYTIGIGKEGRIEMGRDRFGRTQYVESTLDETGLRSIAEIGEGKFFRASNNKALSEVFKMIDTYEKSEIIETRYKETKDFYADYLMWAIVFWLAWLASKATFISNALED